ncbi:triphosphoribosyl-dephospho-CoA synthase CitG [Thermovenabulum gondwanense]|uniref:triphosphoribosyl-dephospho-CoA synthase n=1 Tax=Thermovenabulum gondwanense TaxID=520767 RepID=A0A162MML3_9FIRM|nr:triphosphoribosyl-dephospho-CoA synthase CitG [Thermovenabulum gondwanense]KYO66723.1 2-(5''-triphosphoribosyl)-3'-dephosphocoenzyme-A synthase [Thermovenabulum gondwanense]
MLQSLLTDEFSKNVGRILTEGMLVEVKSHPSPGLVSPFSKGSHRDMDYNTFLRSTAALSKYMPYFVQIGLEYDDDILKRIRKIGFLAEKDMFSVTSGVNTQKGLIFLCGLIGASVGRCRKLNLSFDRKNISNIIKDITKGIVERELKNIDVNKYLTNGERLYLMYGIEGIRGEVERGLPTVLEYGLPAFEEGLKIGLNLNDSSVHSLIHIMAEVEDTTVINRKGLKGLYLMKDHAKNAIYLGGMSTKQGRLYIEKMDKNFIRENISPGGAADLLAVTYIIYKLEKMENNDEI